MTKQIFFYLSFCLFSLASNAQGHFTINLRVQDGDEHEVFYLLDLNKGQIIDSQQLVNKQLRFQGVLEDVTVGRVSTKYKNVNKSFAVYLDTNHLDIKSSMADFENPEINASVSNAEWIKSRNDLKSWSEERNRLMMPIAKGEVSDTTAIKTALQRVKMLDSLTQDYRINTINSEQPTYFTLHELFFLRTDLSSLQIENLFSRFPPDLQNSKDGKYLAQYLLNARPKVGDVALEVKGRDSAGQQHSLSEYKGKYVLLDFWASWCVPCRQQNPELIQVYEKYGKKGFEILGFSMDGDKNDWLGAVRKDRLPWISVSDSKGYYSPACAAYHVRAIPASFLIDPKGVVVAINPETNDLGKRMNDLIDGGKN